MAVGFAVLAVFTISLFFIGFTLLFCSIVLLFDLRKKYSLIPGPKIHNFIWGSCKEFEQNQGKAKYLVFEDLIRKHGPVIVTWNMHKPTVTVSDPSLIEGILRLSEFKDGISSDDLDTIFDQRFLGKRAKFLNGFGPVFDKTYTKRHLKSCNNCCEMFIEKLETVSDGKSHVMMTEQFQRLAVDVVAKIAFGINLNCMQDPDIPFYKALKECQFAINWSKLHPLHKWDISTFEYQNDIIEAVKYLRDFGKKVVDRRRTDIANGEAIDHDYLMNILEAADNDATVTFDNILDEFVAVFISGQSQLTSLLSNMLMELLLHPSIEEKIYEEVINVTTSERPVMFEDLEKLKLTSCVMKETVRLHPLVSSVEAKLRESTRLGNHTVPKNTTIQLIPYLVQTNTETWKEPKDFVPERFLESSDVTVDQQFPHALWKHNYINSTFAECLVKVIFPSLLNKFKFALKDDQDVTPTGDLMSVPTDGVICTLMQM